MGFVIGIDPGLSGAAACLDCGERPFFICDAIHMPTMLDGKAGARKKRKQIDERALADWLRLFMMPRRGIRVVIERVGAQQRDGVVGAFKFGLVAGQIRSTVRLVLGVEPEFVEPQIWKGWFDLGQDKERSRLLALKLFPESWYLLERKMDEARAEAMLIAKWAVRPIIGK